MKRSVLRVVFFLAMVVVSFGSAEAGPITAGVMSAKPAADNSGSPFYHGASWDCGQTEVCNAGAFVPPGLSYLHDGSGGAVAFGFSASPGEWWLMVEDLAGPCQVATDCDHQDAGFSFTGNVFRFVYEFTGFATENVLGWRDVVDSAATGIIFTGDQGPGAVAVVALPARFSLWYQRNSGPLVFDSLSDPNQFALFGPAATVPEPASLLLLVTGLVFVASLGRRGRG